MKKLLKLGLLAIVICAIVPELLVASNGKINWSNVFSNGVKIVSGGVNKAKDWIEEHPEEVKLIKEKGQEITEKVKDLAIEYITNQGATLEDTPELAGPYSVTRVVDGDTLVVCIDGEDTKVRLIGVDTPESVHVNYPDLQLMP